MPQVVVTQGAARGLERCRQFLAATNRVAARRAGEAIAKQLLLLETLPEIGKPVANAIPEMREMLISFGDSGYVALYRHEPEHETVYVLAVRHQKEAGY